MKMYKDFDTGEEFTIEELKTIYNQFEGEMQYDSFEDYMDKMLDLGRQKVGGLIEV